MLARWEAFCITDKEFRGPLKLLIHQESFILARFAAFCGNAQFSLESVCGSQTQPLFLSSIPRAVQVSNEQPYLNLVSSPACLSSFLAGGGGGGLFNTPRVFQGLCCVCRT